MSDTISKLDKLASFNGNLAQIIPRKYLVFDTTLNNGKEPTSQILIRNTSQHPIAFKLKLADTSHFRCKPTNGSLAMGKSQLITLTLLSFGTLKLFKDVVLLMVVLTPKLLKCKNVIRFFSENEKRGHFNNTNCMKHILHCAINLNSTELNKEYESDDEAEGPTDPLFPLPYEEKTKLIDSNFSNNQNTFIPYKDQEQLKKYEKNYNTRGVVFVKNSSLNNILRTQKYPVKNNLDQDNLKDVLTYFREEDTRLKKHIKYFKIFQIFIFLSVVLLCCTLIFLFVKMNSLFYPSQK